MASFLRRKGWGYHEDQRVTTHPIRGQVPNTSVADSIFDGITYSKGAATMKQLLFLMHQQNFSKALSQYFTRYAFKNATLDDFITEMQKHFKFNHFTLNDWRKLWLEKASLNQLEISWDQKQNHRRLNQKLLKHLILQIIQLQDLIKFQLDYINKIVQLIFYLALILPSQVNIVEYDGNQNYKGILLNYEDHSFVKTVIDPVSLNFFSHNLDKINDILSRTIIWTNFYEMIKEGLLTSVKFIQVFTKNITKQSSDSIFQKQFDYVYMAINSYTPSKYRATLNDQMFDFTLQLLQNINQSQTNRIVILKQRVVNFASSHDKIKKLLDWKYGKFQTIKKTLINSWTTMDSCSQSFYFTRFINLIKIKNIQLTKSNRFK